MRSDLFERLRAATSELAEILAGLPTGRVVMACREILECDAPTATQRFGLHSPYRQTHFILAILATSPEPVPSIDRDSKADETEFNQRWTKALALVGEIFDLYWRMYWPKDLGEWTNRDSSKHERDGIAMRAFLHQHMTGALADMPQVLARVRSVLTPFDTELEQRFGLSATTAAAICQWLHDAMQLQLDRDVEILRRLKEIYDEGVAAGTPTPVLLNRAKSDSRILDLQKTEAIGPGPFTVTRAALERMFGERTAATFWRLFVTRRGSVSLPLGIDDSNPVEGAPLMAISEDTAMLAAINPLPIAIWRRLQAALDTEELRARFARRRGRVHEDTVERVIREFVGSAAEVFRSTYEQPDAQLEHDLIVLFRRTLIVIEAKAAPLDPVFRDPERAVMRLQRQFRAEEGIQAGVDQAERIRRRLVNEKAPIVLHGRQGKVLKEIRPTDLDEVLCVCVTADDYGVLATDLSLFLERSSDQPFPWVVNAYDLETFLKALQKRGWGADRLVEFLLERRILHGRVQTTDELEVAGIFIRHGSLRDLINAKADLVQLTSEMSSVFDEIFLEDQGGPPAVLDAPGPIVWTDARAALMQGVKAARRAEARKSVGSADEAPLERVGRNDPCPCGSGLKYKRCHGR